MYSIWQTIFNERFLSLVETGKTVKSANTIDNCVLCTLNIYLYVAMFSVYKVGIQLAQTIQSKS